MNIVLKVLRVFLVILEQDVALELKRYVVYVSFYRNSVNQ